MRIASIMATCAAAQTNGIGMNNFTAGGYYFDSVIAVVVLPLVIVGYIEVDSN